jgi:hypothetical protein
MKISYPPPRGPARVRRASQPVVRAGKLLSLRRLPQTELQAASARRRSTA